MLKPNDKMLEYLTWERGVFFHFGIRTFNEGRRDWDYVHMDLSTFAPEALDCEQWIRTVKEAGFTFAVMTAKHHDGFCLWQSGTSDYSVKNTPWKGGKGDVVAEYLAACRQHGIKAGLYYSPADQIVFQAKLAEQAHNDLIAAHLTELCTTYGPIDYIWFDNCGSDKCTYRWDAFNHEILQPNQPDMIINSNGPAHTYWVGNEAGYAPYPAKYTHSLEAEGEKRFSREVLEAAEDGMFFSVSEADCRLRQRNWFYSAHDGDTVKNLDALIGIYYLSVGRGVPMLINVPPDRRGRIPERDRTALIGFGDEIKRRFSSPVRTLSDFARTGNRFTCAFAEPAFVNHVVLAENIRNGLKIRRYSISADSFTHAREPIELFSSTRIGHKAIAHFPTVYVQKLFVDIEDADPDFELTDISVFSVHRAL
ncbi:MAG: alpha-L-fucosidase [Kiritimatiellae bacterium]|nr:alpha-L-fucosidase [Kiritimatiellia bacterium]